MKRFDLIKMGKRLQAIRYERGLTVKEVTKDTWVSASTIRNYENALCVPTIINIVTLAEYYGVTLEWICYGE